MIKAILMESDQSIVVLTCEKTQKKIKVPTCIVSGRPLTDCQFWMCATCRHCAYENEVHQLIVCPLCHTQILG